MFLYRECELFCSRSLFVSLLILSSMKKIDVGLSAYSEELGKMWGNDPKMISWSLKNHTPYMMSNGLIYLIDRPSIKKDFCFGYHTDYSGHECSDAEKLRSACVNSENFFLTENLKGLREMYYEVISDEPIYWTHTNRLSKKIVGFVTERGVHSGYYLKDSIGELVSQEDRAYLKLAYEKEIEKFTKRLNAYLKRYGLSKLNSWTYWLDE